MKNSDIRRALSDFEGVEHRLEFVATVDGVRWINDSKATNVNSCWYALESILLQEPFHRADSRGQGQRQ